MMRLIEENYKLRDQLKRQEKETRARDSQDPPKERSRSPKRGRSPKKKAKREFTDEEEERIIRENKRRDRSKSRRRERSASTTESRKEFLKLADETTCPKSAPPRRARSTKPERRTPKGSVGVFLKENSDRCLFVIRELLEPSYWTNLPLATSLKVQFSCLRLSTSIRRTSSMGW